jgi:hypothetical protein
MEKNLNNEDVFAKALLLGLKVIDGKIEIDDIETAIKFIHKPIWMQASITEDEFVEGEWYQAGRITRFDIYDDDLYTNGGWVGCLPFRVDPEIAGEVLSKETPKRMLKTFNDTIKWFKSL